MKQPNDGDDRPENRRDPHPRDTAAEEREIDEALEDSFPASDAPPWTLGVTSGGAARVKSTK